MQVQNNLQIPNTVPNFKAIKSIKSAGLYKNQPRLVQGLVETFQTNKTAMDFCKKYDVDIATIADHALDKHGEGGGGGELPTPYAIPNVPRV